MTAPEIYDEALRRGLRLEMRGNKLAVIPAKGCQPEFADLLRAHKSELLSWLDGRNSGLSEDCLPWLHIARQVMAGEFEGLKDKSVAKSLKIGLQNIHHPLCQQALQRLDAKKLK
jgi:hypothetical protein